MPRPAREYVSFAAVVHSYERWLLAKAALVAVRVETNSIRASIPSGRAPALEARAAYADWWRLAGEFERQREQPGFRAKFAGHWETAMGLTDKVVDADPPRGPLLPPSHVRRRQRLARRDAGEL